jgi:hypothetical protein
MSWRVMSKDKYYRVSLPTIGDLKLLFHPVIPSVGGFIITLTYILIKDTKTLYPTEGFFMDLGEKFTRMSR